MTQFLEKELADKVVFSIQLHPIPQETILRTFKVSLTHIDNSSYQVLYCSYFVDKPKISKFQGLPQCGHTLPG